LHWKEYQKQAAAFFTRLGLETNVELAVEGARGVHKVDVNVSGSYHGIDFYWIVECKAWKSNVPKEKVMALSSIVQDLGADRGFLLSEKGFQSGAIRAAQKTNITLTSLEDLSDLTIPHVTEALIGAMSWRILKTKTRLAKLKRHSEANECDPNRVEMVGQLAILEMMLQEASEGKYPIRFPMRNMEFSCLEELFAYSNRCISASEKWTGNSEG